eukprot:CAMPEP_0172611278 /NCGR_PEP_ID=MMETSP1068-20121228/30989_1 /TAXON_ID=35684 /ORGANISM="Pseudopedinella elastica, Strain CCMP716" /LENGTH=165 /DNA_ID=CAMNT_0013415209 /DNA_START=109 /DNA_END=606 /DNA_ORIENTATION=-
MYDDFLNNGAPDVTFLDEDNVRDCLEEFVDSDYGQAMFGKHPRPASVGITGSIEFVELEGPEVVLSLSGAFWHRRETVLGRAAVWLNAKMPEIVEVRVADLDELEDEEVVRNEYGDVLFREDRRAPDFNGDRATMEYQGNDPDARGPFPQGIGGFRSGGSMINPA